MIFDSLINLSVGYNILLFRFNCVCIVHHIFKLKFKIYKSKGEGGGRRIIILRSINK